VGINNESEGEEDVVEVTEKPEEDDEAELGVYLLSITYDLLMISV